LQALPAIMVTGGQETPLSCAESHDREGRMMATASRKRSLVKAANYRLVIVCLEFLVIYLLTAATSAP
jgi:hypothetical protein